MNTRPILKRFFRVAVTTLIYSGIFYLFNFLFTAVTGKAYPIIIVLITVGFLLYFHEPITWSLRKFIDRTFYRKIFQLSKNLNSFNKDLNKIIEYEVLTDRVIQFLEKDFPDYGWAIYLRWGVSYELFKSRGLKQKIPALISIPKKNSVTELDKAEVDFINFKKIGSKFPDWQEPLADLEPSDELYYFFPLKSYRTTMGFILIDKKMGYFLMFRSIREELLRIMNKVGDVLQNAQYYSEVRRKSLQNQLMLTIGNKISGSLNLREVLEAIIDSIEKMVKFDAAGLFIVNKDKNSLHRQVTRGYDNHLLDKLLNKMNLGSYGQVITSRKIDLLNDVTKSENYYEVRSSTRSQVTIPLIHGDNVIGVISLESDRLNHFTPLDIELLKTFANQAIVAIENAQLFEESVQKKRLESELIVASKVQNALLPERPPHFEGFHISFLNIPSRIVGGDFFDIFLTSQKMLGIAIGDISGKGAPASILMAVLYAGFKSLLKEIYPVVEVVARLNNLLTETTAAGYYATFFFGMIDQKKREFTFTNAGHNPPILIGKNGSVEYLRMGGVVLGFLSDQDYRQQSVTLKAGDYLVFYTDGVTEVKNSQGEEFGEDRLIKFVQTNIEESPEELRMLILEKVKRFCANSDLPDDLTLALVKVD